MSTPAFRFLIDSDVISNLMKERPTQPAEDWFYGLPEREGRDRRPLEHAERGGPTSLATSLPADAGSIRLLCKAVGPRGNGHERRRRIPLPMLPPGT